VGKTALAVRWAHDNQERFPDGQLYMNLRGYGPGEPITPSQALNRFLRALDVPAAAIPVDLEAQEDLYRSLLAERRVLVILDNASAVHQVRPLLPGAGECLVVVTSRSRLSGLAARDGARRIELEIFPENEAVNLVLSVIEEIRSDDSADDVAELARLCARLPLALRIAAERAASRPRMPLNFLIRDLRDESARWDALSSEYDEEADAVHTVFSWSYRALPEDAARLFRFLGLHPGPEISAAAAAALADISLAKARRLLDVLVGAHLLEETAPERYQFHDLLHAYATDRANHDETSGSRRAAVHRVLSWYLHTADTAAVNTLRRGLPLEPSPVRSIAPMSFASYDEAYAWHELEHANLIEAIRVASREGFPNIAWQLAAALQEVFWITNPFTDWFMAAQIGLDAARQVGDLYGEAESLYSFGMAYTRSHQFTKAADHYHRALALRREIGDKLGETASLNAIGLMNSRAHRLREAISYFESTITISRELNEPRWQATSTINLVEVYIGLENLEASRELLEGDLLDQQEPGNTNLLIARMQWRAIIQRELGDVEGSLGLLEKALRESRESHLKVREGSSLLELGTTQLAGERFTQALESFLLSANIHRTIGDRSREARALGGAGEACRALGHFDESVGLQRSALDIHRALDEHWWLAVSIDRMATVLHAMRASDEALLLWEEALLLLSEFDDPKALSARSRVRAALGSL
jgi:tetratricopeptide (TPR) repeat protein